MRCDQCPLELSADREAESRVHCAFIKMADVKSRLPNECPAGAIVGPCPLARDESAKRTQRIGQPFWTSHPQIRRSNGHRVQQGFSADISFGETVIEQAVNHADQIPALPLSQIVSALQV